MQVQPFLMFQGRCEEAMNLYVSLFADGRIVHVTRYGPNQQGPEGSVMMASFVVGGQTVRCTDSPVTHGFRFTPSFSLFVSCEIEADIDRIAAALADGGSVLMPLADYGFSRKFTWLNDRFGVSWQLNLEEI